MYMSKSNNVLLCECKYRTSIVASSVEYALFERVLQFTPVDMDAVIAYS